MQDASGRSQHRHRSHRQHSSHPSNSPSSSLPPSSQVPDHLVLLRGADMEAWESESPMAAVTLPSRPQPPPPPLHSSNNNNHSLPLPPRGNRAPPVPPARPPTLLSRTASLPPVVPPRPESTLTPASRRLSSRPPSPQHQLPAAAPTVTPLPPFPSLPPPPPPPAGDITLASPRPEPDRVQNLYVEAPLSPPSERASSALDSSPHRFFPSARGGSKVTTHALLPHQHQKKSLASVHSGRNRSKDKSSAQGSECDSNGKSAAAADGSFRAGEAAASPVRSPHPGLVNSGRQQGLPSSQPKQMESIICIECGKCRCNACQAPKKLPEKWLCGGSVKCSPDSVVDALSCMCCVKGVLYHCGKDSEETDDGADPADLGDNEPCTCAGSHAAARWTAMGLMSLLVPCLWCYLPLRGCAKATQAVYERCNASGCRCPPGNGRPANAAAAPASVNNRVNPVISSEPASTSSVTSSILSSPLSQKSTDTILSSTNSQSSPIDAKQRLLE